MTAQLLFIVYHVIIGRTEIYLARLSLTESPKAAEIGKQMENR
jgi:hypothetical protein